MDTANTKDEATDILYAIYLQILKAEPLSFDNLATFCIVQLNTNPKKVNKA